MKSKKPIKRLYQNFALFLTLPLASLLLGVGCGQPYQEGVTNTVLGSGNGTSGSGSGTGSTNGNSDPDYTNDEDGNSDQNIGNSNYFLSYRIDGGVDSVTLPDVTDFATDSRLVIRIRPGSPVRVTNGGNFYAAYVCQRFTVSVNGQQSTQMTVRNASGGTAQNSQCAAAPTVATLNFSGRYGYDQPIRITLREASYDNCGFANFGYSSLGGCRNFQTLYSAILSTGTRVYHSIQGSLELIGNQ